MRRVLVLGAAGRIARHAVPMLAGNDGFELTLFVRDRRRLADAPRTARVIEGDVLDDELLMRALTGQDVVYANLAGKVDAQARQIVRAMSAQSVARIIFITSLGIYDEVPGVFGEWNRRQIGDFLPPYRAAADAIEASDLDYTILRPAWLTDKDEIDYETTRRDEPFRGTEVSRKSVADLVTRIIAHPEQWARTDVGVNKPGTDGDRPAFI